MAKFKDWVEMNYGLSQSKQTLIDEMILLCDMVKQQNAQIELPIDQIVNIASEIKLKEMLDDCKKRLDDVKAQVVDNLNSRIINNDKKPSNKEKDNKNERTTE